MLGANVAMLQAIAIFMSVTEHSLGFRSQWQFDRSGNLFPEQGASFDLFADRLDRNLRAREEAGSQRFVFAHQAEEQMLRFDCRSPKLRGFVTSEENYPARFFGIAFEHSFLSSE